MWFYRRQVPTERAWRSDGPHQNILRCPNMKQIQPSGASIKDVGKNGSLYRVLLKHTSPQPQPADDSAIDDGKDPRPVALLERRERVRMLTFWRLVPVHWRRAAEEGLEEAGEGKRR
jgi:hypothetical protein